LNSVVRILSLRQEKLKRKNRKRDAEALQTTPWSIIIDDLNNG